MHANEFEQFTEKSLTNFFNKISVFYFVNLHLTSLYVRIIEVNRGGCHDSS